MSDDDDFMQDSDADDEQYDFEYEDDGSDEEGGDIDLENRYYNAKALKEDDPKAAIDALREVVVAEGGHEAEENKGDWGFKALKQMTKLAFHRLDDKQLCLRFYKELLTYTKTAVTRNYSEKSLNNILDYVSTSNDLHFMELFYSTTLSNLAEAKNDRLWLKTNLKLAKLWLDRREFDKLSAIIREMHESLEQAGAKAAEDAAAASLPPGSGGGPSSGREASLLEIYALEIQMYTEMKDNKQLRELYDRTLRVKSSITHPRTMAVIRECGGKMHMYDGVWKDAQQEFFEAFRSYDEAGSLERLRVLKYLVLANMLAQSEINPFDSQETKPYRDDPQITPMTTLVEAYQRNDIAAVEQVLRERNAEIMGDLFIAQYVNDILKNIRTSVLKRVISPYTRVKVAYLAQELGVSTDEVTALCVELILDGQVSGRIDAVAAVLELQSVRPTARHELVTSKLQSGCEALLRQMTARLV
ncbi:hypothetical protein PYCC9005_002778 [Savitreella phatthalungensis]